MVNFGRIWALITKEVITLLKDPKGRMVLITPPLLQLLIFSFAATLEVKNVKVAIYNEDMGKHGFEIVERISGSKTFADIYQVHDKSDFENIIDNQIAIAAVHIPVDFSRDIEANTPATIQVILDGRKSNGAQIVNGYLATLVNNYEQDLLINEGKDTLPAVIIERNWYNENLLYIWYTVPSLVGILSMLITLIITSMSVARERELGTYDQLLVSPLRPTEILIGKMAPAIIIGLLEGLLIWVVAVTIYGVPFRGSFVLLVFSIMLFALSIVGVGLFISSIAKTQQQAILGTFVFMVPSVSLSGYASPVENMPGWLQTATSVIPLKHFLITVKGLFLKDMTFLQVWSNTWPLLIIGSFTLTLAAWFFTKRLD